MSGETARVDWPALMARGYREARLTPAVFWDLTPAELMICLGRDGRPAPMGRSRLEELARLYPDRTETDDG